MHSRQEPVGPTRDEHDAGVVRWLFKCLQKGVLGGLVEKFGLIDDETLHRTTHGSLEDKRLMGAIVTGSSAEHSFSKKIDRDIRLFPPLQRRVLCVGRVFLANDMKVRVCINTSICCIQQFPGKRGCCCEFSNATRAGKNPRVLASAGVKSLPKRGDGTFLSKNLFHDDGSYNELPQLHSGIGQDCRMLVDPCDRCEYYHHR
jgi:hypothetical protein